jgi:hypothetical protein
MQNLIWMLVLLKRNNKHEYGPMNITTSLLHPVYKSRRMNSLENFYTHLSQQHKIIISEQSQTDENHFFNFIYDIQLKRACQWPTFILSHLKFDISKMWPADTTT